MCTVKDLIEKLKTLPEHTIVNVIEVVDSSYAQIPNWVKLSLDEYSETFDFIDLKDNPFCNDEERKKTPTLDLGST